MKNKEQLRLGLYLLTATLVALTLFGSYMWSGVMAQTNTTTTPGTTTLTATATTTGTTAATTSPTASVTTAASTSPTVSATTVASQSPTASATTAATASLTATLVVTPTAVATMTPTAARPTAVRTAVPAVQPTLPSTRTITFSGTIEMPPVAPSGGAMARTITVLGEGRVFMTPDMVTTLVGVETISDTVRLAADENARVMTAVMNAIRKQGVAQEDIQTSGFSVFTERQPAPQAGGPDRVLYHVMNNVSIKVRQLNSLSAILDAAITAGANSISGVQFSVDNTAPLLAQARELAIADALAKATALADLTGVRLGAVMQVSESVLPGSPIPFAAREAGLGGGGGPISPGQMEVSDQVQVTYAIQ